jgi:hypothetical protein
VKQMVVNGLAIAKRVRDREEVSAELRRVDGDMQALIRRYNVSRSLRAWRY